MKERWVVFYPSTKRKAELYLANTKAGLSETTSPQHAYSFDTAEAARQWATKVGYSNWRVGLVVGGERMRRYYTGSPTVKALAPV